MFAFDCSALQPNAYIYVIVTNPARPLCRISVLVLFSWVTLGRVIEDILVLVVLAVKLKISLNLVRKKSRECAAVVAFFFVDREN